MAVQNPMDLLPTPIRKIADKWSPCTRCDLHKGIFHHVFYRGECPCEVLFVGEAPGKQEDKSGIPFIGRSGDILDFIIDEVGIPFSFGVMNVLACIPSVKDERTGRVGVREPKREEAEACNPRFVKTIEKASPMLIVLLGKTAKKYMSIPDRLRDIPILELKHPAYMLRQGGKSSLECSRAILYLRETLEEMELV